MTKAKFRRINLHKIFDGMDALQCLKPMVWYYQCVQRSIKYLAGDKDFANEQNLSTMPRDQVLDFRRYINTDLDNLSLEFYLQRVEWAKKCRREIARDKEAHKKKALTCPTRHPCLMKHGFNDIVYKKRDLHVDKRKAFYPEDAYTYEQFLGETLPMFVAIHNHLASINRALGNLYYFVTEVPFSAFTPTGKTEILHMTNELERLMLGLLVATHLQERHEWQGDIVNYLISCRSDCQRFFDTIPRYYQNHRLRLVIFPIDPVADSDNPYVSGNEEGQFHHPFPLTCLPWSAGAYLDFISTYESIVHHLMAVFVWSVRLYSVWTFVPRRYLRLISPMLRL